MGIRVSSPKRAARAQISTLAAAVYVGDPGPASLSKESETELQAALGKAAPAVIPALAELFTSWRAEIASGIFSTFSRGYTQRVRADLQRIRTALDALLSAIAAAHEDLQTEELPGFWRPALAEWSELFAGGRGFDAWRSEAEGLRRAIGDDMVSLARPRGPEPLRMRLARAVMRILEDAGVECRIYEQGTWARCVRVGLQEALGITGESVLKTLKAAKTSFPPSK
jgi:hypothetical protein